MRYFWIVRKIDQSNNELRYKPNCRSKIAEISAGQNWYENYSAFSDEANVTTAIGLRVKRESRSYCL